MLREFLVSVASGLAVAFLSAIFMRSPRDRSGPSQSMSMNAPRSRGFGSTLFIFLLGAAVVFAAFFFLGHGGRFR